MAQHRDTTAREPGVLSYPWYIANWRDSESRLTMNSEEKGIYRELLDYTYHKGSLPADEGTLIKIAAATPQEWKRSWPRVKRAFYRNGERFFHETVNEIRPRLVAAVEQKRDAARKSASARASASVRTSVATGVQAPAEANGQQNGKTCVEAHDLQAVERLLLRRERERKKEEEGEKEGTPPPPDPPRPPTMAELRWAEQQAGAVGFCRFREKYEQLLPERPTNESDWMKSVQIIDCFSAEVEEYLERGKDPKRFPFPFFWLGDAPWTRRAVKPKATEEKPVPTVRQKYSWEENPQLSAEEIEELIRKESDGAQEIH
jgi:uncharacterized protein YdaU (DUF1376 family)